MATHTAFTTMTASAAPDKMAPDGSEIRLLPQLQGGSMVHCRLEPGAVTKAIRHKTVEEIWYILAGAGDIWRKSGDQEEVTTLQPGVALTIPLGTYFQFRAAPDSRLDILIVTLPPWPNDLEAEAVADYWPLEKMIV